MTIGEWIFSKYESDFGYIVRCYMMDKAYYWLNDRGMDFEKFDDWVEESENNLGADHFETADGPSSLSEYFGDTTSFFEGDYQDIWDNILSFVDTEISNLGIEPDDMDLMEKQELDIEIDEDELNERFNDTFGEWF